MMSRYVEPTDENLRDEAISDAYEMQREIREYEFADSAADQRWERWCEQATRLLGHGLDGDQDIEGYSLDEASTLYNAPRLRGVARITPEQYAQKVRGNPLYKGGPQ